MDYEKDITIDETALDVEWLNQPKLMMRYGKLSAKAELSVSVAKQNLEVTKAELDKEIRSNPEKFGIEKMTETAVANTIISNPEYKDAMETYNTAVYELSMAKAAVRAFEHKKEALENLVRLFGQQYFAGPTMPRDLSQEKQRFERQKETNVSVSGSLKRNR